ncbi:hypothetical protein XENTR_v10019936 [Xenopus tropicalis]|nr:hypothetical protein XENTR_v10019936 [Xenopus tropicalis]
MDSLTDSQSASQREAANEDVTSKSDVSDVTLAPEALQPTHTLKDTATLPTDPSEPASEDIQAPLEQGVRTPQPNAPPPTPLKTGS